MATQLQIRRGTAAQVAAFTGAEGEIVYNSTTDSIHTNDGATVGGFELARVDGSNWNISNNVAFTTISASGEIAANGGIALGDNDKATFGDSDDLEIFHDGTRSLIRDSGTGNLLIRATDLSLQNADGATYASFVSGGAGTFYHNNAIKLATTATGIAVTGTASADQLNSNNGKLFLDDNGSHNGVINAPASLYVNFDSDNTSASEKIVFGYDRDGTSGGTSVMEISSTGIDVTGNTFLQTDGAALQWKNGYQTITGDAASNDLTYRTYANHIWKTTTGASSTTDGTERMRIDSSGNVGIGTSSPSAPLHVDAAGMGDIYSGLIQNSTTDTDHYNVVRFIQGASGSAIGYIGTGGSTVGNPAFSNSFVVGTQTSSPLVFATNDSERMRIDSSGGLITNPAAGGHAVFNEDGVNADFRVESDANTHMLFVDASADGVNIGGSDTIQGQLNVINNTGNGTASNTQLYITTGNSYGISAAQKNLDLIFQGYRDGAGTGNGAKVRMRAVEQTGTSRVGVFYLHTLDDNGNLQEAFNASYNNVIFNDESNDQNFRVESDSNANMLVVDAGNNVVSVGASTSTATLGVHSGVDGTEAAPHFVISAASSTYQLSMWLDGTAAYIGQDSAIRAVRIYSGAETAGVALTNGATSWSTFSDERLKENVEPIENALQSLSGLRTVKYHLKDVDGPEDKKKIGVIAQDLVGVLDEVIDPTFRPDDDTEYMGVRYTELVPVLIKAIQEQQTLIESLTARITALES